MSTTLTTQKRESAKQGVLWLVTLGLPLLVLALPLGVDPIWQRYFAITLWGLLSWVTVVIPVEATGLAIPILYMFCGVVPGEVAFAPWQNAMVWNTIAIILVGTACDKTGISKRMAYSVLLKIDCSIRGLVWGFSIVGMLLAFLISDSFSRMIIFVTIAIGICRALNIPFKSKEASALGLAAFFGMSGPSIGILTKDDFDITDAKVLFVVTGAIAVGSVAGNIGLVDMIVERIGPALSSSPFIMVFGTFVIGSLANFVLTPIAIVFTLTEPFTRIALSAGINPVPVMYALNFATDIYIFPYEFAIFLVCFSFGLIAYKDLIKVMLWRVACGFGIFLVICVPLWKLCGLI